MKTSTALLILAAVVFGAGLTSMIIMLYRDSVKISFPYRKGLTAAVMMLLSVMLLMASIILNATEPLA